MNTKQERKPSWKSLLILIDLAIAIIAFTCYIAVETRFQNYSEYSTLFLGMASFGLFFIAIQMIPRDKKRGF
jgi:hypothetical protein